MKSDEKLEEDSNNLNASELVGFLICPTMKYAQTQISP